MQLPQIPFEVILAVLFFVLPAVGNLLGKRKEKAEREKRAESSMTPTETKASRPSPQATTLPTSPASPTGSTTEDWLEQARRRVAEAQGQQPARRGATPSSPPLVKPRQANPQPSTVNRPTTPARTPQERTQPSLEGRSLETRSPNVRRPEARNLENRSLEGASLEGRSVESGRERYTSLETSTLGRNLMAEAPPIHVQRLKSSKHATITRQELRFDAHDIAKGLIWHQVLSPPRSTLRRTRLSRRQH